VSSSERRRERRARELARRHEQQQAQPSSTNEAPPRLAPEPEAPLASPGPVRAVSRWFVKWVWRDKSLLVTWLFRFFTVLSVSYLVYDRLFETALTISAAASDPKDAFKYPFSINNNSHLFLVTGLQWQCLIISIQSEHLNMTKSAIGFGTNASIQAGQNLNITCDPSIMISQAQRSEIKQPLFKSYFLMMLIYYGSIGIFLPIQLHLVGLGVLATHNGYEVIMPDRGGALAA
jgi:hypothetical protein